MLKQPIHNRFYVIEAESEMDARTQMVDVFGDKWGFCYSESEWIDENGISQAEKYNLKQL